MKLQSITDFLFDLYLKKIISPKPYPVDASDDVIFGEILLSLTIKSKDFKQNPSKGNLLNILTFLLKENDNLKKFVEEQSKEKIFFILWSRFCK